VREEAASLQLEAQSVRHRLADYLALTKPRVVSMVLVTTLTGFYLGSGGTRDVALICNLLLGTALAAGGTLALNQFMERDLDARMMRTRTRPLPDGRLRPGEALWFGLLIGVAGCGLLYFAINPLTALVTASISVTYLLLYTPLKRVSSICSIVGAVPGALPPVAGWAAARGTLEAPAWVLFAIMFLWQLPHSLAIAQLYSVDYGRAGIKLLPTEDPTGGSTGRQIVSNSLALLAVGLIPSLLGFAGAIYGVIALAAGVILLVYGVRLAIAPSSQAARRVMFASLVYLPVVLVAMVLDKV
jgi:protoheme IX farnesyltransferase